jgi:UDP-N-acetylglucosamine 2-epimerase (non-hydrolysing)
MTHYASTKIILIAGARPNFMKISPLMDAMSHQPTLQPVLVHTGQHYDEKMSDLFFRQLGIPEPDVNLGVGSGSHAAQTAEIMKAFEPVVLEHKPDAILVVGDVNSTIACSIVAAKLGIKIIHVEAGLRSFDRAMPEEINRILTDSISDFLFCSEQSGVENLRREGIAESKIHFVGNVMIDTLIRHQQKSEASNILSVLGVHHHGYALVTLHRPSNVDDANILSRLVSVLIKIGSDMPVIFPVHPRTRQRLAAFGIEMDHPCIRLIDPVGYLEFLKLMSSARLVLTDSGGIQEETTVLKVPCLTLRENTERPCTVEMGSNRLVGTDPARILNAYDEIVSRNGDPSSISTPPLWDGHTAERIVRIIKAAYS